jgi:hypothetical protein
MHARSAVVPSRKRQRMHAQTNNTQHMYLQHQQNRGTSQRWALAQTQDSTYMYDVLAVIWVHDAGAWHDTS